MKTSSSDRADALVGSNIAGLLGIAFVVLKLTHVIGWSWWLVTAPFWGGLALATAIAVTGLVVIAAMGVARRNRKDRSR